MSTTIIKIITVVLKLAGLPAATVISMVESVLSKMTANTNFTTPNPPLATITTEKDELVTALADAQNGSRAAKAVVKVKLRTLMLSMETLRAYVQTVSNGNAETAEEVALSSGMDVKRITPRARRQFTVVNTALPGQLKTYTGRVKYASSYDFEYKKADSADAEYVSAGVLPSATRIISDLSSATEYSVRWCSISKDGRSAWSSPINIVVL